MSRLKNDELRKLRSTFDQFRTEVESQMINLIQENDKLRCENGRLRMKMTQIERNGFLSEGSGSKSIRKTTSSASALFSPDKQSSSDEFSPGSPIKTLAKRSSRRRIDFSQSIKPITSLKRAYNGTSKTVSNIVTSTIRLGDIFLPESELPCIEIIGTHKDCITDIKTSGDTCVSSSLDTTCQVWRKDGVVEEISTYKNHRGAVNSVDINNESTFCASASGDKSVQIWSLSDMQQHLNYEHKQVIECAAFSGDCIISGSWDGELKLFDIVSESSRTLLQSYSKISYCSASPYDPNITILATYDGEVDRIDNRGNEMVKTRFFDENLSSSTTTLGVDSKITCARFIAEHHILSTSNDKHIRIWDLRNNQLIYKQQISDGLNKFTLLDQDSVAVALDTKKLLVLKGLTTLPSVKLTKYSIPCKNVTSVAPYQGEIVAGGWSRDLMKLSCQSLAV